MLQYIVVGRFFNTRIMSEKEKAIEMVRKQFDIIAKASNYKGLKAEGEKKFYTIEKIAKQCAIIGVDELIESTFSKEWYNNNDIIPADYLLTDYWEGVKQEIAKL